MGNKQEELETTVQLEIYDLTAVIENWWDKTHNWSTAIISYKQVRRDGQGRRQGARVALYVKKSIACTELSLKNSKEQIENLWEKTRV